MNGKWVPPANFNFPVTAGGRKYNLQWEKEYAWLRYSVSKNAAYCIYCILFGNKLGKQGNHLMVFHNLGFVDWKNAKGTKRGALPSHEGSEGHKDAAMKALAFKGVCDGKLKDIHSYMSEQHEEQVKQNRNIAFHNRYYNCSW